MSTRRDFLKGAAGAAGVVFTSCDILDQRLAAQARQAAPTKKKRQAMVGGKRVKAIDVHAHVIFPEVMAMLGRPLEPTNDNIIAGALAEERFARMDEWGIDMQALSINAVWLDAPRDLATQVIKLQNEKLAELVGKYPDRFVAYASVALQFPDLAAEQLEEGIKKYHLNGVSIPGHVGGEELSNPKYNPFWKKAEELGCLIFMHPQGVPELNKRLDGNGGLLNVVGYPLDTTIFLSHLIFDGTLDKFPGLKLCSAHGGGFLPSYIARSDYGCIRFPESCRVNKKHASEYLKQLYFDSMVFTPEGLRHLVAECGPSQLMIGTDYPFAWSTTMLDEVLTTPGLSDNDKRAILGGNAQRLLKIKA